MRKSKILIFGASGFIGSSLKQYLENDFEVTTMTITSDLVNISNMIEYNDAIIHCAGVTRSINEDDFFNINFKASALFFSEFGKFSNKKIIYFSSIHYKRDDLYGYSKRFNEFLIKELPNLSNTSAFCIRTPGIFGPGAKPNAVSVVSTFCYNEVFKKESTINDSKKIIELLYIDDLAQIVRKLLNSDSLGYAIVSPDSVKISVGDLYNLIRRLVNEEYVNYNDSKFVQSIVKTINYFKYC